MVYSFRWWDLYGERCAKDQMNFLGKSLRSLLGFPLCALRLNLTDHVLVLLTQGRNIGDTKMLCHTKKIYCELQCLCGSVVKKISRKGPMSQRSKPTTLKIQHKMFYEKPLVLLCVVFPLCALRLTLLIMYSCFSRKCHTKKIYCELQWLCGKTKSHAKAQCRNVVSQRPWELTIKCSMQKLWYSSALYSLCVLCA
jgi:hypothetical protein